MSIRVATGYGQPPSSVYDWTLSPSGLNEPSFRLPPDVERRLLIERFCNKVTKALYSNRLDSVGLIDDAQRSVLTTFLARDFEDIEEKLGTEISCMSATSYLERGASYGHRHVWIPTTLDSNFVSDCSRCICVPKC